MSGMLMSSSTVSNVPAASFASQARAA